MRFRSPLLAAALLALPAGPAAGQQPGAASPANQGRGRTLAGVVTDTGRTPIPGVEIGLLVGRDITRAVRTGPDGRFELTDLPRGKTSIVARRLGYQPRVYTVQIREGAARAFLPVVLDPMPAELEKVIVLARVAASRGRLREFYERKARGGGWGTFIDREEIERRHPLRASDILFTVPGVRMVPTPFGNAVRFRGGCAPTIWVDGTPVRHAELDELVFPNDIAGIEVYRSLGGMPAEFMDRNGCGAVVVWTRVQ